jgi:hypothetical protein
LSSNEIIASTTINIADLISDASLTKKQISLNKKYYDSFLKKESKHFRKNSPHDNIEKFEDANTFWLNCKAPNKEGVMEKICKIRIQIDVLPLEQ